MFQTGEKVRVRRSVYGRYSGASGVIEDMPASKRAGWIEGNTFDYAVRFSDGYTLGYDESELEAVADE